MYITIISLVLAFFLFFLSAEALPFEINGTFLSIIFTVVGAALLLISPLIQLLALGPIQKAEEKLLPRLTELYRKDRVLFFGQLFLVLFSFVSFILAMMVIPHSKVILAFWIIGLGLSLDFIRDSTRRIYNLLNPFYAVDVYTNQAKKAITGESDETLWKWIDAISEVAVRAAEKSKTALSMQALNSLPPLLRIFFTSSKSVTHAVADQDVKKETGRDETSYTLLYTLQWVELIHEKALRSHLETVCIQVMTALGKITYYSATCDLSLVVFPAHTMGRCALKAQRHGLEGVAEMAISTLLEVSKAILTDIDVTYSELQEPFRAIIGDLDSLSKAMFKKDKTINIKVLSQPFKDLKALFETEKMAQHRDTPVIVAEINRVLAEFDALDQVLRTMPPLPTFADVVEAPGNP